jgi:D-galactarolactone cycloisomerase
MIANEAPAHRRPLGSECPIQLAGGQNIPDRKDLEGCFNWFAFVQPDIGKWCDVDGCLDIARKAVAAGKPYCPHWFSSGVGLLHSAHVRAAAGW